MQNSKRILVALVAVLPQSAVAGKMGAPKIEATPAAAVSPAQSSDSTGFYVRGKVGRLNDAPFGTATRFIGRQLFEGDRAFFGLHVGYLHDLGTVVVGGELEVNRTDIDVTSAFGGLPRGSLNSSTLIKATVGFDAGRLLPHAVAGFGWVDTEGPAGEDVSSEGRPTAWAFPTMHLSAT